MLVCFKSIQMHASVYIVYFIETRLELYKNHLIE